MANKNNKQLHWAAPTIFFDLAGSVLASSQTNMLFSWSAVLALSVPEIADLESVSNCSACKAGVETLLGQGTSLCTVPAKAEDRKDPWLIMISHG
jgi:hypothetical protein